MKNEKNSKPKFCIWITGLSGSGKTTLSKEVEKELRRMKFQTILLDGDRLRSGLNKDLGMNNTDRSENVRRAAEVAKLFYDEGFITICALISPFRDDRSAARRLFPENRFVEVHLNTDISVCEQRDPKGLYIKARSGEIQLFTGINSPYEPPKNPEIVIDTAHNNIVSCANKIIAFLNSNHLIDTH